MPHQTNTLEQVRLDELHRIRPWLPPRGTVLDIGGGNGFQAKVLHDWGYQVVSIDIPDGHYPWNCSYFPVLKYDGCRLPFADRSFDVVFSSNMLEHVPVKNLPLLIAEMRRVVRPGGKMIHVVPSAAWRFWTTLAHYPFLAGRLATRGRRRPDYCRLAD